ncbi:unnamed protein product [Notodromas monacha]|uniref:Uncharacterized protein n=1 Tax=Notodromas monacha TaxID=399045 RepID=A0A7R9GDI1_9CRUS|nr:unnamed protein product [Notodromas monacha]CAG0916940.1 unnamed protein product [Notodromas monacha]
MAPHTVAKKEPPAPVLEESSAEPRCLSSKNDAPSYWDADEEASYASDLRSSSYLVINNRHGRPPAPHPPADSYPVSSQSSHYWPSSTQMDDFEPSDPGMSIVTSGVYYPPPSPPPAPERDPACLKDINYGPGHEKFPSWPMPPAPVNKSSNPNGSQRTKSWTDQTEYPKEKARPYLRPWMVKKQPVWAEPGLPDPGDFPAQKLRRPRAPLPPLDKDGRQYGDVDYNLPSPPERDSSHREKWREPD